MYWHQTAKKVLSCVLNYVLVYDFLSFFQWMNKDKEGMILNTTSNTLNSMADWINIQCFQNPQNNTEAQEQNWNKDNCKILALFKKKKRHKYRLEENFLNSNEN